MERGEARRARRAAIGRLTRTASRDRATAGAWRRKAAARLGAAAPRHRGGCRGGVAPDSRRARRCTGDAPAEMSRIVEIGTSPELDRGTLRPRAARRG
jgi:hypothetical protein